jgi:protein-tyrosine phosphatase
MESYPNNHRAKWTDNETIKLLNEVKNKTPFHIIAENHQRTIGAIKYKLIRYAIDEMKDYNKELSMEYLMKLTNLSKDELLEGFKKLNFEYNEKDNTNELILVMLDDIKYNIKQIWLYIFAYAFFQFIINFKYCL